MYKLSIETLTNLKKQLEANNKVIGRLPKSSANTKLFKDNEKQIKLITEHYYV